MRAKFINEFKRGEDPHNAIGIGTKHKIEQWMKEHGLEAELSDTLSIKATIQDINVITNNIPNEDIPDYIKFDPRMLVSDYMFYRQPDKIINRYDPIVLKKNPRIRLIVDLIKLGDVWKEWNDNNTGEDEFIEMLKDIIDEYGYDAITKEIKKFQLRGNRGHNRSNYEQEFRNDVVIRGKRISRSDDEKMEEDLFNVYAFIGKPGYKAVEIDGEEYHKKYLEIENLYKIDKYNKASLSAASMMKLRAQFSDSTGQSKAYFVKIPKYMADEQNYYDSEIDGKLRKYVDENKYKM